MEIVQAFRERSREMNIGPVICSYGAQYFRADILWLQTTIPRVALAR